MTWARPLALGVCTLWLQTASLSAQAGPPDGPAIARAVFSAIDAGDLTRAAALLDASFQLHYQGIPDPIAKPDFIELMRSYLTSFPDMRHDIQETLVSGNAVTVRLVLHATHKGAFEGIQPTGRQVSVGGLHILRIVNGKIREWWAAEDDLGLYRQLGMVLKPTP